MSLLYCFLLLLGLIGVPLIYGLALNWRRIKPHLPAVWQEIKRLLPGVLFWAFLGALFGAIGVALMMRLAGLPPDQATGWFAFGIIAGWIWGMIWGVIFKLTEQDSR